MKQTLLFLSLAGWLISAVAADAPEAVQPKPELELNLNTAKPPVLQEKNKAAVAAPTAQEKVLEVDEATLLANTDLLNRAMYSAVMVQNIPGIKVLLPIYEKWPQHDKEMAMFGRALVLQAEGQSGKAVELYRQLIAEQPDSSIVRMQMAKALFEDQQNEAAADQFDRLRAEALPEEVLQLIESYRTALRRRDAWQFYGSINIAREQNINQAPEQQRIGRQLKGTECENYRKIYPGSDCFQGWTFDKPIDATGISYQAGAEKKWSLNKGFYAKAGADLYGKIYRSYSRYNDSTARLSAGFGYADQRNDIGITPFHERRFYGNHAYSYSNGARIYWNRWIKPNLQSLTAFEAGRLKNKRRVRSDINNRLYSGALVYYPNARQNWLIGTDFYQDRNKEDRSDNFNRYGLRVGWGQEWNGGLSSRVQVGAARRLYQTPSFFSQGERRSDKELYTSVSLWHRALHFYGITPRLTFSHSRTSSNDVYYNHKKNRMFIEMGKVF
ncbi:surface lipoprotein assembly modifier [Neisseria zalophi]|uniref:surface lipoprotein assembly modifier n=1 Tax=Neisseria zalophi TaxID=640030 RepID=UPI0017874A1F|nr:surface lipoprotein assembly modifier [Neisseria zalophi]